MVAATKKKKPRAKARKTCGDFGGKNVRTGKPCGRVAAQGVKGKKTGPCSSHTAESEAGRDRNKERVLKYIDEFPEATFDSLAKEAGVSRHQLWKWRQSDPKFDAAMESAFASRDQLRCRLIEDNILERSLNGKASAAETIFYLVNRDPSRWRHINRFEHSGPGGGPVQTENKVKVPKVIKEFGAIARTLNSQHEIHQQADLVSPGAASTRNGNE